MEQDGPILRDGRGLDTTWQDVEAEFRKLEEARVETVIAALRKCT